MLLTNKVPAAAHAGAIAPCEVTVPAQNTGWGMKKTSSFKALGIITKISRGTTEILSDMQLIKTGDKVGASKATLVNMLNIPPPPPLLLWADHPAGVWQWQHLFTQMSWTFTPTCDPAHNSSWQLYSQLPALGKPRSFSTGGRMNPCGTSIQCDSVQC